MLSVSNISLKNEILKNISFSAEDGEIIGIIGPGGAGKTTLLDIISGNKTPDYGRIIINKKPVESYSAKHLARNVFYFDKRNPINTEDTVENFILLSRAGYKKFFMPFSEYDKQITEENLRRFDLFDKRNRRLDELSLNDQSMAMVAHILTSEADILLFKNPTGDLDLKKTTLFEKTLMRYVLNGNKLIIIASNDINHIARVSDRIIIMKDGEVVKQGGTNIITPENIKNYFDTEIFISRNIYNGKPELHLFPPQ